MTTRSGAPVGAPCWADLWTSDVERSRHFYSRLFGWEALDADPNYGGYFNFARQGAWIAGCMGPMGDMAASNSWKPYLATDDIEATLKKVEAAGGQVMVGAMPVGDLGIQAVVQDPTGAVVGAWQPGAFSGFGVLEEDGAPSWFELHTAGHSAAVAFYRDAFGVDISPVSDTDEFRYFTFRSPGLDYDTGGIMDARMWVPEGGAHWDIYWEVDDIQAAVTRVEDLGGSIRQPPEDTPYGKMATGADPQGAEFKLRTRP